MKFIPFKIKKNSCDFVYLTLVFLVLFDLCHKVINLFDLNIYIFYFSQFSFVYSSINGSSDKRFWFWTQLFSLTSYFNDRSKTFFFSFQNIDAYRWSSSHTIKRNVFAEREVIGNFESEKVMAALLKLAIQMETPRWFLGSLLNAHGKKFIFCFFFFKIKVHKEEYNDRIINNVFNYY